MGALPRDTIPRVKNNINLPANASPRSWPIRQIVLCLILFGSGIAVGYSVRDFIFPNGSNPSNTELDASSQDDPSWGPADAKVTMVEFGDFQCPYCRQWYSTVYEKLQANYGNKIRFIFRDFPLTSIHPDAKPAAVAANCAGEQGRYWEYFRLLYGSANLGSAIYQTYAQAVVLDPSKFNSCIKSDRFDKEVILDLHDGERLGVSGVPAFFINGRLISGLQPYEAFQQVIDDELNK
jgi:protein-disulfide isomerase